MSFTALYKVLAATGILLAAAGCSTWRCRGFLDAREMPTKPFKGNYVLESIEFRHMAPDNLEAREASPQMAWLSEQDGLIGTSYLDDIGQELGMTNARPDSVRVRISIVPMPEVKSGRKTIAWPMCCTLGIFPAHLVDEIPFDAIVQFISKDEDGREYPYANASVGLVRTDYQCGLSRLDMDAPPGAQSAVGEIRDDGTVGTGRELRAERLRGIFVKSLAAIVKRAVAERERLPCEQVPQSATEFGPVSFPASIADERTMTPGYGKKPEGEPPPAPMTLAEFKDRAWRNPKTPETERLKKLVQSGFITKAEWEKQIDDLWGRTGGGK